MQTNQSFITNNTLS